MSVTVDAAIGRQSVAKLAKAILVYQDPHQANSFATVHKVTGVDEGAPALAAGRLLCLEELRTIHKALYKMQKLSINPPHVLASSPERLVWFEPAWPRVMFYSGEDAYLNGLSGRTFPQPPLLFIAGERSLRVFALASDERPKADTKVYTAPYYNTSSDGVCLGTMPLPTNLSPDETDAYAAAFFHSAFTHGTAQRLLKGWGGSYGELWTHVHEGGTFPVQHLVPLNLSVEEIINV